MPNCTSCGSKIPDGQGRSCSMCMGDISHGTDGYYEQWALEELRKQEEKERENEYIRESSSKCRR